MNLLRLELSDIAGSPYYDDRNEDAGADEEESSPVQTSSAVRQAQLYDRGKKWLEQHEEKIAQLRTAKCVTFRTCLSDTSS